MATETSDLQAIQDLITAGTITADDVVETKPDKDRDGNITADSQGVLKGGDGDDTYIGQNNLSETFFIDGRDDNNDEGRHVNVIQNFELNADTLRFRLDGGFFQGLEQTTRNNNQAEFTSARDFADLMLSLNVRNGNARGTDRQGNDSFDDSNVEIVNVDGRKHIVLTFDDSDHREDYFDKHNNFKTNDITLVFDDYARTVAATFANELGFDGEFASPQDDIIVSKGGTVNGGDGDNLFILSDEADTVFIDDRFTNNDESEHVNIIHGFDLTMDSLRGRFDGGFFDGSNQSTFDGAVGILQLLNFAESVDASTQDLILSLQPVNENRDPLTLVFTDTTLAEVQAVAVAQVFDALVAAGVIKAEDVEFSTQDGIIVAEGPGTTSNNDGDDLLIGTAGVNTFFFDGRHDNNDEPEHVDAIIGFGSEDQLSFRLDGGFFEDFDYKTINNNQALVAAENIDVLGAFLGAKGGENAAFYNQATNSTVLVIDDNPTNPSDNLTIVLYDAGNLLV